MTDLAAAVARHRWYHTLDLGNGVVTPGMFDHREHTHRYLLPESTEGMRCLDVGTMDGFWAFELERRGSSDVVAVDLEDPNQLDWPPAERARVGDLALDVAKGQRFELVREAYGSSAKRELCSVYDLDPANLGQFDLVFCGDLICHLKDPVTALQRIMSVCRGSAVIATPVERFRFGRGKPLVQFDGIDAFAWWVLSEAAFLRMMEAVGFVRNQQSPAFELPTTGDKSWKGLRSVIRGWVPD